MQLDWMLINTVLSWAPRWWSNGVCTTRLQLQLEWIGTNSNTNDYWGQMTILNGKLGLTVIICIPSDHNIRPNMNTLFNPLH